MFWTSPHPVRVALPIWLPPTRRSAPATRSSAVSESRIMYSIDTSPEKAGLPVAKVQIVSAVPAYGATVFATFNGASACFPLMIAI